MQVFSVLEGHWKIVKGVRGIHGDKRKTHSNKNDLRTI
jgi:hypothetical protein